MLIDSEITNEIVGSAIEVHRQLGPGLLESAYEQCLTHELITHGLHIERQLELPVFYKGIRINAGYRIDLLVNERVIVELKAVKQLEKIHEAQLLTYLKLANKRFGLLMNFNVPIMKQGIKRILNG